MVTGARRMNGPHNIVFFGFDVNESSQIKMICAIQASGNTVQSFTFRRDNMNKDFVPDWTNIDLGQQSNKALWKRLLTLPFTVLQLLKNRHILTQADTFVARNLDMVVIALLARLIGRKNQPVLYQCFDIHSVFTKPGLKGVFARWFERRCLARVERLVVTSPRFLSDYFVPTQGFKGDHHLLENKIWWNAAPAARPQGGPRKPGPFRLGWVGTLRCPESLNLLTAAAKYFGKRIEVQLHGVVHHHNLPGFEAIIQRHSNIIVNGPFTYPSGLPGAYENLDLVWAQDLWQPGANSKWLLPNRIYEAAYFGCPCLAVEGNETAAKIARDGLGFSISGANASSLINFMEKITQKELGAIRTNLLARPASDFCLSVDDINMMLDVQQASHQGEFVDVAPT